MPSQQKQEGGAAVQSGTRSVPQYDPRAVFEVRWRDVEYRHDGTQSWLARVYEPQGPGPLPAIVKLHGGAWNRDDRTQNAFLDEALAAAGLVVASIDFRLGTQAPYPASMADINYATRWLKAHAADFNGSAEGVGGVGHSSGGHQIMLSAMRPRDPRYAALPLADAPEVDASLAYVILAGPVIDPYSRYLLAKEKGRQELVASHDRYFQDEATMKEASPQFILERGEAVELPPALFLHGADDDILAPQTAERFVEA
jgi:acetyl esterase/lipase